MKLTAMAKKKIHLLFPGEHEKRERLFLHNFLLSGDPALQWGIGLQLSDIPRFAQRCSAFSVQILGFEIHPDSPFQLVESCYEDFTNDYDPDWYLHAMKLYFELGITHMIIPVIDVNDETLKKYLI